jgi:hypothetical protein
LPSAISEALGPLITLTSPTVALCAYAALFLTVRYAAAAAVAAAAAAAAAAGYRAENASTLHQVLVGLESASLAVLHQSTAQHCSAVAYASFLCATPHATAAAAAAGYRAEYASTLHQVLVGLESASLAVLHQSTAQHCSAVACASSFHCVPHPSTVPHDAAAAGCPAEYASTLHQVLVGLESASLAAWKLGSLLAGYLGLLLFTVYLSSSEVRLPIVQYSKAPPPVGCVAKSYLHYLIQTGQTSSCMCAYLSSSEVRLAILHSWLQCSCFAYDEYQL